MLPPPSTTTMAPPGKRCSRCPCHTAVIVFDGEALCAACDDGTHPAIVEQPATEPQPALTAEKSTEVESTMYEKLTYEQIEAVLAAPVGEKPSSIARRLGVNSHSVEYHRSKQARARRKAFLEAGGACEPSLDAALDAMKTVTFEPEPEPNLLRSCTVALDVNEKTLDAWWAAQSLQAKAKLFGGNYVIRAEGFVS
jgi:hypothetical protein